MRQRPLLPFFITMIPLLLVWLVLPTMALPTANTFAVNSTQDQDDALPGDGLCDADLVLTGTQCTLRAAISEANLLKGPDTILLPAGFYTLAISGTQENSNAIGDLDITDSLHIVGDGALQTIVQAGADPASGLDRVFHIARNGISVTIEDMTIQHGHVPEGLNGGISDDGGGILNDTTAVLTVTNSLIIHNWVKDFGEDGGGIANIGGGTVYVYSSTISHNVADNSFASGGGLFNVFGSTLIVHNSIISGNQSNFKGGGVYNHRDFASVTIVDSVILNNSANSDGGGLYNGDLMTLQNTTISGNRALLGGGGLQNSSLFSQLQLTHVTIAHNVADTANGGVEAGGGIFNEDDGFIMLTNTVIADNQLGNGTADDCLSANALTAVHTLLQEASTCTLTGSNNQMEIDPQLASLANNSHQPALTSPLIDQVTSCTLSHDQQQIARPQGVHCDIGAVEVVGSGTAVTPTLTLSTGGTLSWTDEPANCVFDVHQSNAPYGGYSVWVDGTTQTSQSGAGGGTQFYYVQAYVCGGWQTAVSNYVGAFTFSLVAGTP